VRPSGKINLIAVVILGGIAYGVWWVFTFSGIYLDNIDVKEAVESGYNMSPRATDEMIALEVMGKCNMEKLGHHEEDDGYGTITVKGGLGVKPENVQVLRDTVTGRIAIVVDYQRKVLMKPLSKVKIVKFHVKREGPIPY
jgi:hypothetical protein